LQRLTSRGTDSFGIYFYLCCSAFLLLNYTANLAKINSYSIPPGRKVQNGFSSPFEKYASVYFGKKYIENYAGKQ
jgi:hypothetical protein